MIVLEKKRKIFIEEYKNVNDLYIELDEMHNDYLSGKGKNYTALEMLDIIKNRKNTFLTSK